jgi:predicted RNase H-like HicB family nuclease
MKTRALIERGTDGRFGIFTPDINHVIIGAGDTVEEAKADFENTLEEMKLSYTESGREIHDELRDIEFEYKYDLASFLNYYSWINVSKFAKKAGINPSLMRQYKTGKTYISENQILKIEKTLHQLGGELGAIRL